MVIAAVAGGEIAQDRVRFPDRQPIVLEHRNQAVRVESSELRFVHPAELAAGGNMVEFEAELAREPQDLLDVERASPPPDSDHDALPRTGSAQAGCSTTPCQLSPSYTKRAGVPPRK